MLREVNELFAGAAECTRCPAMACRPVLSAANGSADSPVMFVGEAPGRLGAGRTGVPFSGDEAGRRFERLLAAAGLTRDEVFVTNAVLCLPLTDDGRNRSPSRREIRACSAWLERTIETANPPVIVAMGRVALDSLGLIAPHEMNLAGIGCAARWNGRLLTVVYHPGARAQVHRPWAQQVDDWQALGELLRTNTERRMLPA